VRTGGTDDDRANELAERISERAAADDSDMPELVRDVLEQVPLDRRPVLVKARAILHARTGPTAARARRVVDHALAIFGSYPDPS